MEPVAASSTLAADVGVGVGVAATGAFVSVVVLLTVPGSELLLDGGAGVVLALVAGAGVRMEPGFSLMGSVVAGMSPVVDGVGPRGWPATSLSPSVPGVGPSRGVGVGVCAAASANAAAAHTRATERFIVGSLCVEFLRARRQI